MIKQSKNKHYHSERDFKRRKHEQWERDFKKWQKHKR